MPNKRPYRTVIYALDEQEMKLDSVWTLGKDRRTWNIGVYYELGLLVVSEGDWLPDTIHVLQTSDPTHVQSVTLDKYGRVAKYRLGLLDDSTQFIQLIRLNSEKDGFVETFLSVTPHSVKELPKLAPENLEFRLSGSGVPYGGGQPDLMSTRLHPETPIRLVGTDLTLGGKPVPVGTMRTISARGWNLVANLDFYRAFWGVPDGRESNQREVLIYNRKEESWMSVMVPGSATLLRPVGLWLAGVVAEIHPDTDFKGGGAVPPLLTDEVVLVSMKDGRVITTHLGTDSEVLLVDGDVVYYRIGAGLYRARINGENIVDAVQLLEDPVVKEIHWGF